MRFIEIKQLIESLALSNGFYGRLLRNLNEVEKNDPETFERIVDELERQDFKEVLDVVLYFEQ